MELAELLNETIPHCDWSMLAKNGTDATTIASAALTKKRKVLIARKAYHGAAPWCTPYQPTPCRRITPPQIFYDYNDPQSLGAGGGRDQTRYGTQVIGHGHPPRHRPRP